MDESGPARRIPKGRSRLPDEPSESLRLASSQGVRTVRKRRLSIEVASTHCRCRCGSQRPRRTRMLGRGNAYELAQGFTAARKPRADRADRQIVSRCDFAVICRRQPKEHDSRPLLFR